MQQMPLFCCLTAIEPVDGFCSFVTLESLGTRLRTMGKIGLAETRQSVI